MFSLALGADFQSGKSTTINAMADGREVCPRGNGGGGIRTSACAVHVTCSLDDSEGINIVWKSPERFSDDLEYWTGKKISSDDLSKNSPDLWEGMPEYIEAQLKGENSSPEEKNKTEDKIRQLLMLMSFHDHPAVRAWRSRKDFVREEVMSFLAFPEDNTERWNNVFSEIKSGRLSEPSALIHLVRKNFTPENAMYLFIDIVNFSVPSEYLQAMGVAVVDTPGLNMSDNDTRVALRCMSDAAAIFYLFSGEKQLSNGDKASLSMIKEAGLADKVFFGINFRDPLAKLSTVERQILADLRGLKYEAKHQLRMLHYNAFLAQRAKQGIMILRGKLDEAGEKKLLEEAEQLGCNAKNVKEAWLETTDHVMQEVRAEGYRDFFSMGLCEESVALVYKASMWEETMDAILQYVLKNRGRILLLDYVANPVKSVLSDVESTLLTDEQSADETAGALIEIYRDALRKYERFKGICSMKIREWIRTDWDRLIAGDLYSAVYERCPVKASELAAYKIKNRQTFLNKMGHLFTSMGNKVKGWFGYAATDSTLTRECKAIINDALKAATEPLLIAWMNSFEKSTFYMNTVLASVKNLRRDIEDVWKESGLDSKILEEVYRKIEAKMPEGVFSRDIENIVLSRDSLKKILGENLQINIGGTLVDILKGIAGGYAVAVGLTYIYLYVLPLDFVIPFAAEIIAAVFLVVSSIFAIFASSNRKQKDLEKLRLDLQHELEKAFRDTTTRDATISKLAAGDSQKNSTGTQIYRKFYTEAFDSAVAQGEQILLEKLKKAEEDAKSGEEERAKIATEARQIKDEIIAPIQERLKCLEEEVLKRCPQTGI